MKKILTIAALSIFVFAFSSCKKDHTCECTTNGVTVSATIKETKKKAKEACESGNGSVTLGGQTISTTCTLK